MISSGIDKVLKLTEQNGIRTQKLIRNIKQPTKKADINFPAE